jgi:hypothetical protein
MESLPLRAVRLLTKLTARLGLARAKDREIARVVDAKGLIDKISLIPILQNLTTDSVEYNISRVKGKIWQEFLR